MQFSEYIDRIKVRLEGPLPGEVYQMKMAPSHRKAYSAYVNLKDVRIAAVTILLTSSFENVPSVLLIERSVYDGVHSGQIALPGGKTEEGEKLADTALRELEEETGIASDMPVLLGRLSPLFIPPSRFIVYPFIAALEQLPEIRPQEREVQRVFSMPVMSFNPESAKQGTFETSGGLIIHAPYYEMDEGKRLWGATSMILSELYALVS